jgi:hypothetical protein
LQLTENCKTWNAWDTVNTNVYIIY